MGLRVGGENGVGGGGGGNWGDWVCWEGEETGCVKGGNSWRAGGMSD